MNYTLTFLNGLNEAQHSAVTAGDEPLLVLSAAGTGKTRVLTARIAYLMIVHNVSAQEIVAVTFSNKASYEMKERLAYMLPEMPAWRGTFHSICAKMLRLDGESIGISPRYSIIDYDDQMRLLKQILSYHNIDKKFAPNILNKISRCKDKALHCGSKHLPIFLSKDYEIRVYQDYQEELARNNALDFGDLILSCITMFQKNTPLLQKYRDTFKYVLVDEYQDTNLAQYIWLKLLKPSGYGLCCVGDDDQSIYSWRGAEVRNIIKFHEEFENVKIVRLEQNYRSYGHILGAASSLIQHNTARLQKKLWTSQGDGERVQVNSYRTGFEEAKNIVAAIKQYAAHGFCYKQIAILMRAGFQTREFEEVLNVAGIAYNIVGCMRFYERQEIKDVIAYLRLVYQNNDNLAFARAISTPRRGIGESTLSTLRNISLENKCSMFEASAIAIRDKALRSAAKAPLESFCEIIQNCNSLAPPHEVASYVLDASGYRKMLEGDPEAESRLENVNELLNALEEFTTLGEFLEHVSLVLDSNQTPMHDTVTLMTLHASKGLEYDIVFLCGWEEGLFPHDLSIQEHNLEEERRLAYVGITRARKYVHISYAMHRQIHHQWRCNIPSRFLSEIDAKHVHFQNNAEEIKEYD